MTCLLTRSLKLLLNILLVIKLVQITKCLLGRAVTAEEVAVEADLGHAFNEDDGTFSILNEKNVSFLLQPKTSCDKSVPLLMIVSSGPRNKDNRDRRRRDMHSMEGVRLVFLVSRTVAEDDQNSLSDEHDSHGDIVQSSLPDGHRQLGYKILTGYVWVFRNCPHARAVAKTDDNVVLDITSLVKSLQERKISSNSIICGSGPPHRNMKTLRSARPHMLGNWSVSKDQLESDIVPDFCAGFLYITTPRLGAALVQVGLALYSQTEVTLIEDSLITGVLRERLPTVSLEMLDTSLMTGMWQNFLSYCPWLTVAKLTFFDELVISKTSSRSGVQYVGSITSPGVWRFFICLHIEVGLDSLDRWVPGLVPDLLWDICER